MHDTSEMVASADVIVGKIREVALLRPVITPNGG